jgi:hypothetical protein
MTDLASITKIPDVYNIGMNDVRTVLQGNISEVGTFPKVTPITSNRWVEKTVGMYLTSRGRYMGLTSPPNSVTADEKVDIRNGGEITYLIEASILTSQLVLWAIDHARTTGGSRGCAI